MWKSVRHRLDWHQHRINNFQRLRVYYELFGIGWTSCGDCPLVTSGHSEVDEIVRPGYVVLYVLASFMTSSGTSVDDDPAIGFKSFDDVFGTIFFGKRG